MKRDDRRKEPFLFENQKVYDESYKDEVLAKITDQTSEKTSEKILQLMKENTHISAKEISTQIPLSSRTIEKHIKNLQNLGLLKRVGPDKGGSREVL